MAVKFGKLKRIGGVFKKRFGVYHGDVLLGEVIHERPANSDEGGWVVYLSDFIHDLVRLPGSYSSKEEARDVVVEAVRP
jgi:hypothetical protein